MLQDPRDLRLIFFGLNITFKFLIEGNGILATVVAFGEIHHALLKIGEGNRVKRRLFCVLDEVLRLTNIHTRDCRTQIPQQSRNSYSSRDIIDVAGELDDRWLRDEESGLKPGTTRARREESPDTALRQQGNGQ